VVYTQGNSDVISSFLYILAAPATMM